MGGGACDADAVKNLLGSVEVTANEDNLTKLMADVKDMDCVKQEAVGREQLEIFKNIGGGSGGGSGGAAATAGGDAPAAAAEEPEEEEEEESSVAAGGMFGGSDSSSDDDSDSDS